MNKKEYKKNLAYLEKHGINFSSEEPWDDKPWSVELEMYTNAGEDMIIDLEEPTKECLQEYIDDFDINEEVIMWWPNGQKQSGVPFSNIRDHYDDYDDFLDKLQDICDNWPE